MKKLLLPLAIGLVVAACSGNSSSSKQVGVATGSLGVSGRIDVGTSGGRVSGTPVNSEGGPTITTNDSGDIVFDGPASLSDGNGDYSMSLDEASDGTTIVMIATDDYGAMTYRCEKPAGCDGVDFLEYVEWPEGYDVRAGVGQVARDMIINVNWITDLAVSLGRTVYIDALKNDISDDDREDIDQAVLDDVDSVRTGVYSEYTLELANLHVSKLFSVSDIIYVTPIGPSQITKSTSLTAARFEEGIFYGALIAALPELAASEEGTDSVTLLGEITSDLRKNYGQMLERSRLEDGVKVASEITLAEIFEAAAGILKLNIDYYRGTGARVPAAADAAYERLINVAASLVEDEYTSVEVDVPSELAGWTDTVGTAREFIEQLTEAVKNFWGEDETKDSFIAPEHARRMDAYYVAHEVLYQDLAPSIFGDGGVLADLMQGAEYLIACEYGAADCTPADGRFVITTSSEDPEAINSDRVIIDEDLTLIMRPVLSTFDEDSGGYRAFDFEIDSTNNKLLKNGTTYYWSADVISDGSTSSEAYIRLYYDDPYTVPPPFKSGDVVDPEAVDPVQIGLIWPMVSFDGAIDLPDSDGGAHTFRVLVEANLIGVSDPLDEDSDLRYNPITLVLWLRSVNSAETTSSAIISQVRTTNGLTYYPETKWPEIGAFFRKMDGAPATISNMVSLKRDVETLDDSTTVDTFDVELISNEYINRIRMYPYNSALGSTSTESCTVEKGTRAVIECSDPIELAGNVSLDELIEKNYESDVLTNYVIAANGEYRIDLATAGLVDSEGNFNGLVEGQEYGPFEGVFVDTVMLGIDTLSLTVTSNMTDGETGIVPVIGEFALERQTPDIFSASVAYSFGANEDYDFLSEAIGVGVGANAQAFVLEYSVSEEELANENGELDTIEIERGAWTIYRSGVTLGGDEQTVLSHIVTRTEYTQGDDEFACGLNDRDKLSSAESSCDAVAYLTVRGSLVGTIREERDGVFVARFVDGTWMIIGD